MTILKGSNLNNPKLTTALFAALVKRLGGSVTITQEAIDEIAYGQLYEDARESDGSITFSYVERKKAS